MNLQFQSHFGYASISNFSVKISLFTCVTNSPDLTLHLKEMNKGKMFKPWRSETRKYVSLKFRSSIRILYFENNYIFRKKMNKQTNKKHVLCISWPNLHGFGSLGLFENKSNRHLVNSALLEKNQINTYLLYYYPFLSFLFGAYGELWFFVQVLCFF